MQAQEAAVGEPEEADGGRASGDSNFGESEPDGDSQVDGAGAASFVGCAEAPCRIGAEFRKLVGACEERWIPEDSAGEDIFKLMATAGSNNDEQDVTLGWLVGAGRELWLSCWDSPLLEQALVCTEHAALARGMRAVRAAHSTDAARPICALMRHWEALA